MSLEIAFPCKNADLISVVLTSQFLLGVIARNVRRTFFETVGESVLSLNDSS